MARKVFFSFHYKPDSFRVAKIRNIGALEGNRPAHDNDWETVAKGGDAAIQRWIADQMHGRSCTAVLIGSETAGRRWITHEIVESWNKGMGVVGIHIHGLKDHFHQTSSMGRNPFDHVTHNPTQSKLSSIVKCYDPGEATSEGVYAWFEKYFAYVIDEAITIRGKYA